ncbi:hypothetical protein Tco_1088292 [Tanacetum coccineum]
MFGATRIQVPKDDLYDLYWKQEEDGEVETLDPQFLLGSELLKDLDSAILGGTILVEVILVEGHLVSSIVKVIPVGSIY